MDFFPHAKAGIRTRVATLARSRDPTTLLSPVANVNFVIHKRLTNDASDSLPPSPKTNFIVLLNIFQNSISMRLRRMVYIKAPPLYGRRSENIATV